MDISHDQIKKGVKKFIAQKLFFNSASFTMDDKTSFLESGIIDSTGILELIDFLQQEYQIKILDDEMLPENLDTLDNIATYIMKKNTAS